mmetsp:Transcript_10640/g.20580  ORF Transcript_10640/g.20580 Transcript_10640/m.20580 type:complete len:256 (+) Transcript_10640:3154-3921(+)
MSGTKRKALVQMPKENEPPVYEEEEVGPADPPEEIEKRVVYKAPAVKEEKLLSQDYDPILVRQSATPVKVFVSYQHTPKSAPASENEKLLFSRMPAPLQIESKTMKALLADLQNQPRVSLSPSFSKYLYSEPSSTPTKVLPQADEFEKVFSAEGCLSFKDADRGRGKIEVLDGSTDNRKVVFLVFRIPSGRIIFQGKLHEGTEITREESKQIESNDTQLAEFAVKNLLTSDGELSCRLAMEEESGLKLASLVGSG